MSDNRTTQTLAQQDETEYQQTTLRVPIDVWRAVRTEAFNRNISAQEIWIEGVRKLLKLKVA